MDNVGSLSYSGRLFHIIGTDAVKERLLPGRKLSWGHTC